MNAPEGVAAFSGNGGGCSPLLRPCRCSSYRKSIEVEPVAVDVVARRHVIQPAGDGRIEAEPAAVVLLEQGKPPIEEYAGQSTGTSCGSSSLTNHQLNWILVGIPGWRGAHSDLAQRPEMGALVGLPVVSRDHMRLEAAGRGNEIVGKGEA